MRLEEDKPAGIEHTARVSYNTAAKRVRCVPVPATGTVIAGTGMEFPTRGLPVPNPTCHLWHHQTNTFFGADHS